MTTNSTFKLQQNKRHSKMFSTQDCECVGFESIWKVTKVYEVNSSQTNYVSHEIGTTTQPKVTSETQTDMFEIPATCEVDMERLSKWLNKIYPTVSKELNETIHSQAFKNYRLDKNYEKPSVKLLQSLKVIAGQDNSGEIPRVSSLSWNSTGNTLAISCNYCHKIWCYHPGLVSLFTFDRFEQFSETPTKKLVAETCVSVINFHPNLPFIIAAGTYTGAIIIWNIQNDDDDNVIVKIQAHEENITQLSWISDLDDPKIVILASSSLDGCLCLWNFNSELEIKHKYKIKSPILPKSPRLLQVPEEIAKKIERGVITFDFSPYIRDMFIVGVEGGLLVQCSLLGTVPLKGSTKEVPISDPVYKYFEPHESEIVKVQFSPNRKEMFFSYTNSGQLRIYILNEDEPAQTIFINTFLDLTFIPFHEKIIAGCGSKGSIEIFGLRSTNSLHSIENSNFEITMTRMELNRSRVSTVAVGKNNGVLELWSVPWSCFNQEEN
ncbi:cytoplasmic dynein 2 intermediate chain 2-like isoform X1 [Onthophagus taurus]|uniref:cytoplasmic dynein 2 intermediate chain 2-like isoform X1 n=2 Tax=Onthophagus taurus TaxID=166361 RepID=UPI0039BE78CF